MTVASMGYEPNTWSRMASVCRRFPMRFRERVYGHVTMNSLSFHHFRAVTALKDEFAEYWLKKSAENGWGESKYTDLIEGTGYDKQKLMEYAHVARRFTTEFRKNILGHPNAFNLSFWHFRYH